MSGNLLDNPAWSSTVSLNSIFIHNDPEVVKYNHLVVHRISCQGGLILKPKRRHERSQFNMAS